MTIHYHGLPITGKGVIETLAGGFFCGSYATCSIPDIDRAHRLGQGVMLDNGAFSIWRSGKGDIDIPDYWRWTERWIECPTTWAVIPDRIEGDWVENMGLVEQTPRELLGNPNKLGIVWHLHDPIDRLIGMAGYWPRICFGSSAQFAQVGSESWHRRIGEAFDEMYKRNRYPPAIHMLRGMSCVRMPYPFASVDSTDIARNHHLPHLNARDMMDEWNGIQCPYGWTPQPKHNELFTEEPCA